MLNRAKARLHKKSPPNSVWERKGDILEGPLFWPPFSGPVILMTQPTRLKIKLPRRGQCVVAVAGHIDDLTLRVPDGVLARIYPPAGGTSRIDTVRFPLRDDAYESPGFGAAVDWIEIRLDGAAISNLRIL